MMNRIVLRSLLLGLMWVAGWTSDANGAQPAPEPGIVPRPLLVKSAPGSFTLTDTVVIRAMGDSDGLLAIGRFLRDKVKQENGLELKLEDERSAPAARPAGGGEILLARVTEATQFGEEGYELVITPERIEIKAGTPAGAFWGAQTVLQLVALATGKHSSGSAARTIDLPAVRIVDRPRFAWRGLLLDCSRTFLPIEWLRKYVDVCAFYKMNVLQLHLTDDQGWRLEIRKHPRLTEVGARFASSFQGEISGYYTQQQVRDLVRYAADRHVTLVPEIETPSHCLGLLAAYPDLACREDKGYVIAPYLFMSDPTPDKTPRTPYGVLCAGNERTFEVLEDVFQEVIDLFPSQYIHIAADECPKGFWKACPKCQARMKAEGLKNEEELQSYFVKRVAKIIQARHRKTIGWDEVLEGGLAPEMAVMSWRGMEGGITAAKEGHPVVMASKSHLYFDYCYNRTPASLVYEFEPIPADFSAEQQARVLGVQACMWTHLARTESTIDMSIFPRVLALAEVGWTSTERREWKDFSARMDRQAPILKGKGIRCFERNPGVSLPNLSAGQDGTLWMVNAGGEIYRRQSEAWERFPGQARQVTSGPDGTIWSVSMQSANRGYALMRWSGNEWKPVGEGVAGVQISAAPDGSLYAVTEAYAIWRYADGKWANVQGLAREVSAGSDGTVWILTADAAPGGYELYSSVRKGRWHRALPVAAGVHVAAGAAGQLWMMRDDGTLHLWADGQWQNRPGRLSQIVVAKDGTAWGIAADTSGKGTPVVRWTGEVWKAVDTVP